MSVPRLSPPAATACLPPAPQETHEAESSAALVMVLPCTRKSEDLTYGTKHPLFREICCSLAACFFQVQICVWLWCCRRHHDGYSLWKQVTQPGGQSYSFPRCREESILTLCFSPRLLTRGRVMSLKLESCCPLAPVVLESKGSRRLSRAEAC